MDRSHFRLAHPQFPESSAFPETVVHVRDVLSDYDQFSEVSKMLDSLDAIQIEHAHLQGLNGIASVDKIILSDLVVFALPTYTKSTPNQHTAYNIAYERIVFVCVMTMMVLLLSERTLA